MEKSTGTMTRTGVKPKIVVASVIAVIALGTVMVASNFFPVASILKFQGFKAYLSPEVQPQNVLAGIKSHNFAAVVLDDSSFNKDVAVREINLTVRTQGTNPAVVSNFRLFDGNTQVVVTNDPNSDVNSKTSNGATALLKFVPQTKIFIARGAKKTFYIKGDVSPAATPGVYRVGLQPLVGLANTKVIDAYSANNSQPLSTQVTYNAGAAMTFMTTGSLSITSDPSSPKTGLMPANTNGVTLAVMNAIAQNEDMLVTRVYITGEQVNNGGWDQVNAVYLYQGSTLIAHAFPTSTDSVGRTVLLDMSSNPLRIANNSPATLIFKVDTADSNAQIGSRGASGQGIKLKITSGTDVQAIGAQSAAYANVTVNNAMGNPQYLFRSVPTVIPNDLLSGSDGKIVNGVLMSGSNVPLYRFRVTANSSGAIGLAKVSFNIGKIGEGVAVSNLILSDDSQDLATVNTVVSGVNTLILNPIYTVSAGTSKGFTLRGDLTCNSICSSSTGNGGTVTISLLGDSSFPSPLPTTVTGLGLSHLGWTDFWMSPVLLAADSTVATKNQWSNGYHLPMLNDGQLAATSTPVLFSR